MKNKEKYDLNTLQVECSPQTFKKRFCAVKIKRDGSIIFLKAMKPNELAQVHIMHGWNKNINH